MRSKTYLIIVIISSKLVDGQNVWNEKTKKELGPEYNMKPASPIGVEWDDQAKAIEAKWLKDGIDSVKVGDDRKVNNMPTEATMVADVYIKLAKAAKALVK